MTLVEAPDPDNWKGNYMAEINKPHQMIVDYITGRNVPDVGAEANRQAVEKLLVTQKGYEKADVEVDVDISLSIAGEAYRSLVDLVVSVDGRRVMVIKCAAGSLGSREREVVAAARLLDTDQIPFAVASDGVTAMVLDASSGKKCGEGIDAIPTKAHIRAYLEKNAPAPFPEKKREREKLVFRTYDVENVNVRRNLTAR